MTRHAPWGLRAALCLVLVVGVGIGTLSRIRGLSRWETSRGELALALSNVETVAQRNSTLQWSTIGGAVDVTRAQTEMGQLRGEFDRYVRTVLALEEDNGTGAATLRTAFAAYQNAVDQEFTLLRGGWYDDARGLAAAVVDPVFTNLVHEVEREKSKESARARSVAAQVMQETTWLLGGALALILLVLGALARSRTVSARRGATEATLRRSEERFRALVQSSSDVVTVVDAGGVIRYQSAAVTRVLGLDPEASVGCRAVELVHPEDQLATTRALLAAQAAPRVTQTLTCRLRHAEGSWRRCEVVLTNRLGDDRVAGIVLNIRDVTERHALEEELRRQAFSDSLTGLANRALLLDRVGHALARFARGAAPVAVLLLDLDGFKGVNDSLGHAQGDQLLIGVAEELRRCLRPGDTAARLGGDEFAIVLEDLASPADAEVAAERILETVRGLMSDSGALVTASVGVAVATGDEREPGDMLRDADVAMYVAKRNGKDRCVVFEPAMRTTLIERLTLEEDLRRAVERHEFVVHYQPTYALADGRLEGVEALVRWAHPRGDLIAPMEFIPVAEEIGLIGAIGAFVLTEACHQMRAWQRDHPSLGLLTLSVNVSVRQLQDPALPDIVAGALAQSGLDPTALVLELTESVLADDSERTLGVLARLKALGVRLAIDDFGTGYSSLSYLRRFPIDVIKIDRSFVDGLPAGPDALALVQAIVRLGQTLFLQTVAEGIEGAEQLAELQALGCDIGQGYYLARPMSTTAFGELLDTAAAPSSRV